MTANFKLLRSRLESEHKRLIEELDQLIAGVRPAEERREGSPFGKREEEATETLELEKRLALEKRTREQLAEVEHALSKLEKGTYGLCDICGEAIDPARLEGVAPVETPAKPATSRLPLQPLQGESVFRRQEPISLRVAPDEPVAPVARPEANEFDIDGILDPAQVEADIEAMKASGTIKADELADLDAADAAIKDAGDLDSAYKTAAVCMGRTA